MEVHTGLQSVMVDPKSGYPSFSQTIISTGNVILLLRDSTIQTSIKISTFQRMKIDTTSTNPSLISVSKATRHTLVEAL